jgi:CheY-like chemotaxis protein
MSVPVVSITTRDGRIAVVFKRDGILEGWAYFDELSYEVRAEILTILETQGTSEPGKIDLKKIAKELPDNDPFTRARCRVLARVAIAHELGLEADCVHSRSDGHPYIVLEVPESIPQDKRIQDWLTVYFVGVEAEKRLYGSYTGDGTAEIAELAHQFHLDKNHLLQGPHTATEQQKMNDFKQVDVKKMAEELRDRAAWAQKNKEAALNEPYHLFFFSAVDRDGVTRFFDIMKQEDGFSLAETATSAPRLGQCIETIYGNPGGGTHHVHRNYGKYRTVTAPQAMQDFATLNGLTQLTEMGETLNQLEASPTWKLIFEKLGCPTIAANPKPVSENGTGGDHARSDAVQNRRILAVHHERLIAELICKLLLQDGYETGMECSSADAIRRAGEFAPHLLIIDPVMPGISGLDAAKQISDRTRCKVLLVSTGTRDSGFAEILNHLRNHGCDCEAFPLPFEKEDLLEHVHQRIGLARIRDLNDPPRCSVCGVVVDGEICDKCEGEAFLLAHRQRPFEDPADKQNETFQTDGGPFWDVIAGIIESSGARITKDRNHISFEGEVGRTSVTVRPSASRSPGQEKLTGVITVETKLPRLPLPGDHRWVAVINMTSALSALIQDNDGDWKLVSRLSFYQGDDERWEIYVGLIAFGALLHASAQLHTLREAFKVPDLRLTMNLPHASEASRWPDDEFYSAQRAFEQRGIFATTTGEGLTAEFPWDEGASVAINKSGVDLDLTDLHTYYGIINLIEKAKTAGSTREEGHAAAWHGAKKLDWNQKRTSLLQLTREAHPSLGNGLFCRLELPLKMSDEEAAETASRFNLLDYAAADSPPFFGSWCYAPWSGCPTYVSFWPNLLFRPDTAAIVASWMERRSAQAHEWIT